MKKQSSIYTITLVVVLVAVSVGIFTYIKPEVTTPNANSQNNQTNNSSQSNPTSWNADNEDWKTFKDEATGFEVTLPPHTLLEVKQNSESISVLARTPGYMSFLETPEDYSLSVIVWKPSASTGLSNYQKYQGLTGDKLALGEVEGKTFLLDTPENSKKKAVEWEPDIKALKDAPASSYGYLYGISAKTDAAIYDGSIRTRAESAVMKERILKSIKITK